MFFIFLGGCKEGLPEKTLDVSAVEAQKLMEAQRSFLVIIDIRTPGEFNRGHLPGAININMADSEFISQLKRLADETIDKEWLIYCRTGNRSSNVLQQVRDVAPGEKLYHLSEGIKNWTGVIMTGSRHENEQ